MKKRIIKSSGCIAFNELRTEASIFTLSEQDFPFHINLFWMRLLPLNDSLSGSPVLSVTGLYPEWVAQIYTTLSTWKTLYFYFHGHHLLKLNEFPVLLASLLSWVIWIYWTLDSCWIYMKKVLHFSVYKKFEVVTESRLLYGKNNFQFIEYMKILVYYICISRYLI